MFKVITPNNIDPSLVSPEVYGHHSSFVTFDRKRLWLFQQEDGAKLFKDALQQGEFKREVSK